MSIFRWQIRFARTQIRYIGPYTKKVAINFNTFWIVHALFLLASMHLTNVIIKKNTQFWSLCSEIAHGICQRDQ